MSLQRRSKSDILLKLSLTCAGTIVISAVLLIFGFLLNESLPLFKTLGFSDITSKGWYPLEQQFNLLPMLSGSLIVSFGAIVLALPLGIFSALFCCFYSHQLISRWMIRFIELYAGIPSVIFGFWGLVKIVPIINQWNPPGQSLLAGIFILSLMIFPIITLNLISNINMLSKKDYRTSCSLGLSNSTYIWSILLPRLSSQIISSSLLALGRAFGETMAVLMVCGNIAQFPKSIFDPIRTLTANIALEMSYAMGVHRSSLFLSGLSLLFLIVILVIISDVYKMRSAWKG